MTESGARNKMRESDIDAHLKRAFDQIAKESLPGRFSDLLEKLRTGEAAERERPGEKDRKT